MFVFGLLVPVVFGLVIYGLVLTLMIAVAGWWVGLYSLFNNSDSRDFGWWVPVGLSIVLATIAAFASAATPHLPDGAVPNESVALDEKPKSE